jgi:AcrR family transcriptional regulator
LESAVLGRPLRADAARNRARVIEAAGEAFSECGSDAQMEDVARRAGVGVGTVYRHFATKEALVDALLTARFTELTARVREQLEIDDPWNAVVAAFELTAELQAHDRCLAGALGEHKRAFTASAPIMDELRGAWGELLGRAQDRGVLRPDFTVADLSNLMCGLANVVGSAPDRTSWQRYLAIVLDGLRSGPTRSPLPL